MSYQQSLVRFDSDENLKKELIKYFEAKSKTEYPGASVYGVIKCIKDIKHFNLKVGDLLAVIGGERYIQRSPITINEYLGLNNVEKIIFIDCEYICIASNHNVGDYLDKHFITLNEDEEKELLN